MKIEKTATKCANRPFYAFPLLSKIVWCSIHLFFDLETIGVSQIITWLSIFEKKPNQFWRKILIQVLFILLQLYFSADFSWKITDKLHKQKLCTTTRHCFNYEWTLILLAFYVWVTRKYLVKLLLRFLKRIFRKGFGYIVPI